MKRAPRERTAAAVILFRATDGAPEVYLAERDPKLRFFGGYWAFVGGVREEADGPDDPDGGDRTALRRCARRELDEETGIRCEHAHLHEACRIRTPPFAPVRYDTVFFVAEVGEGIEPVLAPGGELVRGAWWRAADALAAWRRGEIAIVPPAIILLELLEACPDRAGFCSAAASKAGTYARGALHEVRFTPGVVLAPLATATLPPATTTNCLVVGSDRLFVIDPASPDAGEQERLFALCDGLCAHGAEVAGILSTHHHPDHVGGLAACARRWDLPVRAHAITLERLPADVPRGEPLADGDRIPLGAAPDGTDGWYLEALFTPGHDRGHLCFRESRYRALVAGDMVSTISMIVIDPPEGHMRTYLESLERLRGLELGTLYPAHGPAAKEAGRVIAHYLEHRAEREAKLRAALAEGPATVEELVPRVYDDTDPSLFGYAARSLLAGLEKLEEDGAVACDGEVWNFA